MNLVEERNLAGCCGIFCGLCLRFQSKAQSRCLGCRIVCLTLSCKIYNCCVKHRGLVTCAECDDFPCEKNNPEAHQYEYFVTHKPCISNLNRTREVGFDVWLGEQRERRLVLEDLMANYNEGRSMSFYCLACTLMPVDLVNEALVEIRAMPIDDSDVKAKAKALRSVIQDLASKSGIELKLRQQPE